MNTEEKYLNDLYKLAEDNKIDIDKSKMKNLNSYKKILRLHKIISKSKINFSNIKKSKDKKTVLCIEPNVAHDFLLPSFYKYFHDLGYEVDFLLSEDFDKKRWDFFEHIPKENYRKFIVPYAVLNAYMSLDCISEYDVIMLNTDIIWDKMWYRLNPVKNYLHYLKNIFNIVPKTKNKVLELIVHVNMARTEDEIKVMLEKHQFLDGSPIFSLIGYKGIPMLSGQYFGDVKITPKSQDICKFISLGYVIPTQKNHHLLIEAAEKLVENNIKNFKIMVFDGKKSNNVFNVPEHLAEYFEILGEMKPPELFNYIEEADFITTLWDSQNDFMRETFGSGTGSTMNAFQLGFLKPGLMEDFFVKPMGFSEENVISYKGNDLYSAMKRAIEMSASEYDVLQNNLAKEAKRRYNQTINDLKEVISNNEKKKYKRVIIFKNELKSFLQKIFSTGNENNHKLIRILGFKIKIKKEK